MTSKIIKSNHQPITTTAHPLTHSPQSILHAYGCAISGWHIWWSARQKLWATHAENPSELLFFSLHPTTSLFLQLPALDPTPNPWGQRQGVIHAVTERRGEWKHC